MWKRNQQNAFFCQWCGEKLELVDTEAIIERIKFLRKPFDERNPIDLEICKHVSKIYKEGKYLQKYDSLEDFGEKELNIEKSSMFMYKDVGEKLMNSEGELLVSRGMDWGIGKLYEFRSLDVRTINKLIELEYFDPSMSLAELRKRVKGYKKYKNEHKE